VLVFGQHHLDQVFTLSTYVGPDRGLETDILFDDQFHQFLFLRLGCGKGKIRSDECVANYS